MSKNPMYKILREEVYVQKEANALGPVLVYVYVPVFV